MEDNALQGTSPSPKFIPITQVYKATHDKTGKRLSYRYRSFISFSFGGKLIEDFGFISVTDGDRLTRNIYSNFDDVVETYETLDQQTYWGSHLTNNELILKLATDGVNARQLDDFKQWFAPGKKRELILMEHPNRAILARVSSPPELSMLPFKTTAKRKINGVEFTTDVTLFKGEIHLSFTMDEPLWYAKHNIIYPFIPYEGANSTINLNEDVNLTAKVLNDNYKDMRLFVECYESNINVTTEKNIQFKEAYVNNDGYLVIKGCFDNSSVEEELTYPGEIVSLYGGVITLDTELKNEDAKDYAKIILEDNIPHLSMIKDVSVLLGSDLVAVGDSESRVFNDGTEEQNNLPPGTGAHVTYYGFVALENNAFQDIASWEDEGLELSSDSTLYLFYSGTAPSKPKIQFAFQPGFDNDGYINFPWNEYSHPNLIKNRDYNYISLNDNKFYFTTPSLLTGYNQAIKIVKDIPADGTFVDFIDDLKEKVHEYYVRAWAIRCATSLNNDTYVEDNSVIKSEFKDTFITEMKKFVCGNNDSPNKVICTFDSKTGEAIGHFQICNPASNSETIETIDIEENVGDMVRSDYLIIDGRDYPNSLGQITDKECHIIKTNVSLLTNVLITFQNMYY